MKVKLCREELYKILKVCLWDYIIDIDDLLDLLTGKKATAGPFSFNQLFVRMLERLSWYDLIDIYGIDTLKELLVPEVIKLIHFIELRERYEYIRKVLHGEIVSFSGWSPESRKKIKNTLLSNRWYSIK